MRWTLYVCIIVMLLSSRVTGQEEEGKKFLERFFMPALQMGYINHNSPLISDGFMIQTSLDYRTKKNVFIRLNYDDFSGRLRFTDANNREYSGRIPLSEVLGGVGYRIHNKSHHFFAVAQMGIRFYEQPLITNNAGVIGVEQKDAFIGSVRYTLGYEYALFEEVFLCTELFTGHFSREKDFWSNTKPFFGITIGISARLF